MMSYDIVKNISKLKKQVAKFRETVYTKDRSKCLPLAMTVQKLLSGIRLW